MNEISVNSPIMVVNPTTGGLVCVSGTGSFKAYPIGNAMFGQLQLLAADLMEHSGASLIELLTKSTDVELLDNIDWVFSDSVHADAICEPLSGRIRYEADQASSVPGLGGHVVRLSPPREEAMVLLVPERSRPLVFSLIRADFEGALQLVAEDKSKFALTKSLVQCVVGGKELDLAVEAGECQTLKDAVTVVNRLRAFGDLAKIFNDDQLCPFVRAVTALHYVESARLGGILDQITNATRFTSLRGIVLTGILKADQVVVDYLGTSGQNPFPVAIVGLLLGKREAPFSRSIDFVRNTCNRLRGAFWLIRALIDSNKDTAGSVLTCYYCSKPLAVPCDSIGVVSRCPSRGCHRSLPSCSVCLEPIALGVTEWVVWCSSCRHGGHQTHVAEWFGRFDDCPVAGCHCQCANVDGV